MTQSKTPSFPTTPETAFPKHLSAHDWKTWKSFLFIIIFLSLCFLQLCYLSLWRVNAESIQSLQTAPLSRFAQFIHCSTDALNKSSVYEPLVEGIPLEEYIERTNRLASALYNEDLDAFIAEPGFTDVYYVNISSFQWESWEPEERPFLLIVEPVANSVGKIIARTTFLVPAFELSRALELHLPLDGLMRYIAWEEHEDPFEVLTQYLEQSRLTRAQRKGHHYREVHVVCDDEMRLFIAQGIDQRDGFRVVTYDYTAQYALVKQIKSPREVALLRAANTLTVEGIRAVQGCAHDGISELELSRGLDDVLRSVPGVEPFFDLVLFGENAACPHCSSSSQRKLNASEDFVLIDVGVHLHGYSSDVCRTFLLPNHTTDLIDPLSPMAKKLEVWQIVMDAQTASLDAFHPGAFAADIDLAARKVIESAGYGRGFTHRLGHGIGIKAHEPPYLNKGNRKTKLRSGMAFTSEPGIYLPGDVGVRHEDVILVREKEVDILSGTRAQSPWKP